MDQNLYSRQLFVLGKECMQKMQQANILIVGLSGVGLEVAKCIILGGVKSVSIYDNNLISNIDLAGLYYAQESDKGKNRVEVCLPQLKELNPYVPVCHLEHITDNDIAKYNVVVCCDQDLITQIYYDNLCRAHGSRFISCSTYGLVGQIFCDFGNTFLVTDPDGEDPSSGIVASCEKDGDLFLLKTAEPHGLSSDSIVQLTTEDECKTVKVEKIRDPSSFYICDTFLSEGNQTKVNFSQIKRSVELKFQSLECSMKDPTFVYSDYAQMDRPSHLHTAWQVLTTNAAPTPWDLKTSKIFVSQCQAKNKEVPEDLMHQIAHTASGQTIAMHSIIGSMVAQEVMKACSGKYTPIHQWFYYDALTLIKEIPGTIHPRDNRYDGQVNIFGSDFQNKLADSHVFVVGAGAIGCEHLKNFAMTGIGNITITDMDTIEKSNLNRQFLFRERNIGQSKSMTAAATIMEMNPHVRVKGMDSKVAPETSHIFGEKFFRSVDCVANALDNVAARLYVDSLCVKNTRPLLESGTLGTKGNVQVVIPHLTESYGSSQDPPEKSIPVCTLKNFPYQIDHTIQWARDIFSGIFTQPAQSVLSYDPSKQYTGQEMATFQDNFYMMARYAPFDYHDCIEFAYVKFHELFRDKILDILKSFPPDHQNADGTLFWSGTKRCPEPATFTNTAVHLDFIEAMANIWADMFGICKLSRYELNQYVEDLQPPPYVPSSETVAVTEEEAKKQAQKEADTSLTFRQIGYQLQPIEFEKDDDTNFHIDFVTNASNLRALNYGIRPVDALETKKIAGKIVPAIATTTSLVSGLVTIELLKVLMEHDKITDYNNTFLNLALPFVGPSDPIEAKKTKLGDKTITLWDNFEFQDLPLGQIIDHFERETGLPVTTVSVDGSVLLYAPFTASKEKKRRRDVKITDLYREIVQKEPEEDPIILYISLEPEDEDAEEDLDVTCKIRLAA